VVSRVICLFFTELTLLFHQVRFLGICLFPVPFTDMLFGGWILPGDIRLIIVQMIHLQWCKEWDLENKTCGTITFGGRTQPVSFIRSSVFEH